jgi:hypothetical protein
MEEKVNALPNQQRKFILVGAVAVLVSLALVFITAYFSLRFTNWWLSWEMVHERSWYFVRHFPSLIYFATSCLAVLVVRSGLKRRKSQIGRTR